MFKSYALQWFPGKWYLNTNVTIDFHYHHLDQHLWPHTMGVYFRRCSRYNVLTSVYLSSIDECLAPNAVLKLSCKTCIMQAQWKQCTLQTKKFNFLRLRSYRAGPKMKVKLIYNLNIYFCNLIQNNSEFRINRTNTI